MERGAVVGALMIGGSFLLAASLNRSAVEETPPLDPPAVGAPIAPSPPAVVAPRLESCAAAANAVDPAMAKDDSGQGDLPGNGRNACSQ